MKLNRQIFALLVIFLITFEGVFSIQIQSDLNRRRKRSQKSKSSFQPVNDSKKKKDAAPVASALTAANLA